MDSGISSMSTKVSNAQMSPPYVTTSSGITTTTSSGSGYVGTWNDCIEEDTIPTITVPDCTGNIRLKSTDIYIQPIHNGFMVTRRVNNKSVVLAFPSLAALVEYITEESALMTLTEHEVLDNV